MTPINYPVAKLVNKTHCQWPSVKMCEQYNRVIIVLLYSGQNIVLFNNGF